MYFFVALAVAVVSIVASAVASPALSAQMRERELKITSGSRAAPGEFPMAVQLHILEDFHRAICGGSILSPNLILTAAHCVEDIPELDEGKGYSITAVAGEVSWDTQGPTAQSRKVVKILQHEQYNTVTNENDIAILVLDEPLKFGQHVQKVKLPEADRVFNDRAQICGWGSLTMEEGWETHDLRKANVPLRPDSVCSTAFRYLTSSKYNSRVNICAGGTGTDTCKGDSGGPLLCTPKEGSGPERYLCGITSWGPACGEIGIPTAYTRVSSFTKWIQGKMLENDGPSSTDEVGNESSSTKPADKPSEDCSTSISAMPVWEKRVIIILAIALIITILMLVILLGFAWKFLCKRSVSDTPKRFGATGIDNEAYIVTY